MSEMDRVRLWDLPSRPPRRLRRGFNDMPAIAKHHGMPGDRCWRCDWVPGPPVWSGGQIALERAHIVDRWLGGLDGAQNLALLCAACHASMPSIGPKEAWFGLLYVFGRETLRDRVIFLADELVEVIGAYELRKLARILDHDQGTKL